jgi:hypothetical protein
MIKTTRASLTATIAVFASSLACASLLPAAVAAGATAPTALYTHESLQEYQQQLAGGQVGSVEINKRVGSVRVTLKNGKKFVAKYKRKEEPKIAAALTAQHVPFSILAKSLAAQEVVKGPKKAIHHKLRYIVGGIAVAVVVIVGAVLLINRRRKHASEE